MYCLFLTASRVTAVAAKARMTAMLTDIGKQGAGRPAATSTAPAPVARPTPPVHVMARGGLPAALLVDVNTLGADAVATAATAATVAAPEVRPAKKARLATPAPLPAALSAAAAVAAAAAAATAATAATAVTAAAALPPAQNPSPMPPYFGPQERPDGEWDTQYAGQPRTGARLLRDTTDNFPLPGPTGMCHEFFWEDEFVGSSDRILVCKWCSGIGSVHACSDGDWVRVSVGMGANKTTSTRCRECNRIKPST